MTALRVVSPTERATLDADGARKLTDRIKTRVAELLPLIKEAFERRADVALGYANWLDYCDTELRGLRLPVDRRTAVAELREAGMSTRAIGAAIGVDDRTVRRDLAEAPAANAAPAVAGLDGKQYPAARPTPDKPMAEPAPESPATPPVSEPERPKPPAWDPAEREAHMAEVRRREDIRAAQQQVQTLVPDVRALIFTVLQGSRQDKNALRGLITRDMVADLRRAVDLLEGEIDDEG